MGEGILHSRAGPLFFCNFWTVKMTITKYPYNVAEHMAAGSCVAPTTSAYSLQLCTSHGIDHEVGSRWTEYTLHRTRWHSRTCALPHLEQKPPVDNTCRLFRGTRIWFHVSHTDALTTSWHDLQTTKFLRRHFSNRERSSQQTIRTAFPPTRHKNVGPVIKP